MQIQQDTLRYVDRQLPHGLRQRGGPPEFQRDTAVENQFLDQERVAVVVLDEQDTGSFAVPRGARGPVRGRGPGRGSAGPVVLPLLTSCRMSGPVPMAQLLLSPGARCPVVGRRDASGSRVERSFVAWQYFNAGPPVGPKAPSAMAARPAYGRAAIVAL